MRHQRWKQLFWTLLAAGTLWLTLNLHSRTGVLTYKGEIFADKAGYYIYLPATFIYGFDARAVPQDLPLAAGCGFLVDDGEHIYTKYPIGVAVMMTPFFLITHYVIAPLSGNPADGFSAPYHKMVDVAAWCYLLLALLLLAKVLGEYFPWRTVALTLLCFLLGTNLFYYYAVESGMSHIYSFFWVSVLLRLTQWIHKRGKINAGLGLALGATIGMLLVTRFTNGLLLSVLLFWEVGSWAAMKERIRIFLTSPAILLALVPMLILMGLQIAYYVYLTGSLFAYPYQGEVFDFAHPELLKVWFSPHNGLFTHAPLMLIALWGLVAMLRQGKEEAWYPIVVFFSCSYIFASWWQWNFGCAYGYRPFVEYYPLFMIAFAYALQRLASKPLPWRIGAWSLMLPMIFFTFKNGYLYRLCFTGAGDWDFAEWWAMFGQF